MRRFNESLTKSFDQLMVRIMPCWNLKGSALKTKTTYVCGAISWRMRREVNKLESMLRLERQRSSSQDSMGQDEMAFGSIICTVRNRCVAVL